MRRLRFGVVMGAAAMLVIAFAGVAGAGKSGPCEGSATIDGVRYDHTNDTAEDPIVVPEEKDGVIVAWEGSTGSPITDHTGSVSVLVGPIPIEVADWGGANADMEVTASGQYDMTRLPEFLKSVTGLYEVQAEHSGQGGTCEGTVMVLLEGNGLATPIGAGSVVGTVLTGIGLLFAGRGRA